MAYRLFQRSRVVFGGLAALGLACSFHAGCSSGDKVTVSDDPAGEGFSAATVNARVESDPKYLVRKGRYNYDFTSDLLSEGRIVKWIVSHAPDKAAPLDPDRTAVTFETPEDGVKRRFLVTHLNDWRAEDEGPAGFRPIPAVKLPEGGEFRVGQQWATEPYTPQEVAYIDALESDMEASQHHYEIEAVTCLGGGAPDSCTGGRLVRIRDDVQHHQMPTKVVLDRRERARAAGRTVSDALEVWGYAEKHYYDYLVASTGPAVLARYVWFKVNVHDEPMSLAEALASPETQRALVCLNMGESNPSPDLKASLEQAVRTTFGSEDPLAQVFSRCTATK